MKNFKKVIIAATFALTLAVPASAQFRFGIKAGASVSKLKFDSSLLKSDNTAGFTGGVMAEFTVPVLNIGADASVLYARRSIEMVDNNGDKSTDNRNYIDIPVNFKWKIGLPLIGNVITPFITTGPDFSFLMSKKNFADAWDSRKFDVAWNVGAGVEVLSKIQIAASYGFGLTNSASGDKALNFGDGKNRFWTVTAAYLF